MTKEEILEYIFLCISYKHNNDISPYFTKSACEKENLLFENAIEFLDKLEKENAELKEKLGDVQMQKAGEKSDLVWKLKTANEQKAEQLTKAKKIIGNLYAICKDNHYPNTSVLIEQAEQFLKENK